MVVISGVRIGGPWPNFEESVLLHPSCEQLVGLRRWLLRRSHCAVGNLPSSKPTMRVPPPEPYRHRSASSYTSEFLQKGAEVAVAIRSGVQLAETVLPYLRPLLLAAV